jgi:hypothetical protein
MVMCQASAYLYEVYIYSDNAYKLNKFMITYQRKSENPHTHIGNMVWNVLYEQKITLA